MPNFYTFYTEFLTSPNFYTFTSLAHFFSPRCARDCLTFLELVHMAYHTVLSLQRPESNPPPRAHRQFATLGAERRARGAQRGAVGQQGVAAPAAARHDRARVPGGRRSGRARGAAGLGFSIFGAPAAREFLHFYTFMETTPVPGTLLHFYAQSPKLLQYPRPMLMKPCFQHSVHVWALPGPTDLTTFSKLHRRRCR